MPQDACSGDSGGPLIHRDEATGRWTIIGTVKGGGYSCVKDEGEDDNGQWAKVTAHLSWIKEILAYDAVTSTCVNEQGTGVVGQEGKIRNPPIMTLRHSLYSKESL